MKVRIDRDECHPYFIVPANMSTDNDQQVEMTEKEADRVEKAEREYWLVQEFLEEKYEEAKK